MIAAIEPNATGVTAATGMTGLAGKSGITYKVADHRRDRIDAFRLVYQNYLERGLIEADVFALRVTPYHLLPTTNTFIAVQCDRVISTVSLIGDGELGLPMESIYPDEINDARERGLYVGEVSALAIQDVPLKRFVPIFVKLTRLMAQYARARGMDQLWIAAHPKHGRFYERFLGFEQIGCETSYPLVRGAPAVACRLDFAQIDQLRPQCYEQYFGTQIPKEELRPRPITEEEIEFFRPAAELADCCCVAILD